MMTTENTNAVDITNTAYKEEPKMIDNKLKKKSSSKVTFLSLFRYSNTTEKIMIFFGIICSIGRGLTMPFMILILGDLINLFISLVVSGKIREAAGVDQVDIPLPDIEARIQLLQINTKSIKLTGDVDLKELATRLDGYSGADITNICRDASMMSMRRRIKGLRPEEIKNIPKDELEAPVTLEDFNIAISKIQRSVSQADIKKFDQWMEEYGAN
eukprot:jgi/Orpsp1_1/1187289/evm.model.d7180000056614.1